MKYRTRTYYTDAQKAVMDAGTDCSAVQSLPYLCSGDLGQDGRHQTSATNTCGDGVDLARAGRDLSRDGRRPVDSIDRRTAWASCFDGEPRDQRNGGREAYRASEADSAAWTRALRPKCCKLARNRALAQIVTDKLRSMWSPEQVAGWLEHASPYDESLRVSHETIYRSSSFRRVAP